MKETSASRFPKRLIRAGHVMLQESFENPSGILRESLRNPTPESGGEGAEQGRKERERGWTCRPRKYSSRFLEKLGGKEEEEEEEEGEKKLLVARQESPEESLKESLGEESRHGE